MPTQNDTEPRKVGVAKARDLLTHEEVAQRAAASKRGPLFTRAVRRGVLWLSEVPPLAILPEGISVRDVEEAKRWLVAYLAHYGTTKNGRRKTKRERAEQSAPSGDSAGLA